MELIEENLTCFLHGSGSTAEYEKRLMAIIEDPLDVIIHIVYVGIGGSNALALDSGSPTPPVSRFNFRPLGSVESYISRESRLVMGHEASGIVYAVGPAVSNLKIGDEVAIETGIACHVCAQCKGDHYNPCPNMKFPLSPPNTHGTFPKFLTVPAHYCHKIANITGEKTAMGGPEHRPAPQIGLDEATLIEPLATAIHTVMLAGFKAGDNVVIFGAGLEALLCAAVARELGANMILAFDTSRERLNLAEAWMARDRYFLLTGMLDMSMGADDFAINVKSWLRSLSSSGDGFNVAIETTGTDFCMQMAIHSLGIGGSLVETGLGDQNANIPMSKVIESQITVKGSQGYNPEIFN
ncbi:unnamed protein product [Penicillium olsonii]|uniref:D-xylulose reductase n=1 Tax=Penicillium olsonii TaxID=99116 RepID=A0A9W4I992_PENOL|nr:unnamed protein product [Penicillium olsonii]CAG8240004.1 unnamed protein product [Penicillium olsonii]